MSKIVTLVYPFTRGVFNRHGFTDDEVAVIITTMVTIWRCNDLIEDLTREIVFSELELDELTAQLLWNECGVELTTTGQSIRTFSLNAQLIRWVVHANGILLELEDENTHA